MSTTRTQPLPGVHPHITHRSGDRISALVELPAGRRRLVGDITRSTYWTFNVRWMDGHGEATFAHGHEPDHLRPATAADEHDAITAVTRHSIAADYLRMADQHPRWPGEVQHALRHRAAQLTGDTR
jgi:hypothetical protein